MISIATIEEFELFNRVGFYTLKSEDKPLSETDNFFTRMGVITEVSDDLQRLVTWIQKIGDEEGVTNRTFRHEGICLALPPDIKYSHESNVLRLYCHQITEEVVVLFNGDRKTHGAKTSQQCPVVEPHRRRAEDWTTKIERETVRTDGINILDRSEISINY